MKREDFGRFLKTIFFKVTFKNLNYPQARLNNFNEKNVKEKKNIRLKRLIFKLNFNNDIKKKHEKLNHQNGIFFNW